ncbi:DUF349 domain-containing protein [Demequina sp. NBRC 110052]|uniref:DUF349 domain-containing protein n=1 Tax=Demequina sp. NBRC 110052 TaxID=1570341 RepID=UPI0009FDB522|nr:DUF349 domain-containing protein [Demequina sp. NBRC 110052]
MTTAERPADTTADAVPTEEGAVDDATVDSPVEPEAATTPAADASADSAPDEAAPSTDGGDSKDAAEAPTKAKGPKPRAPKPGSPKPRAPKPGSGPSPAAIAAHATHPVKVPVVDEVTPEQLAAAEAFGEVEDGTVYVVIGKDKVAVGPASAEDPLAPYSKAFYELKASVERFHARLSSAELSVKDIDDSMSTLTEALGRPEVVGDVAALRERFAAVSDEAAAARTRIQEERRAAREAALAAREDIVARAEAIAAKPESQVHWKNDTAELRALLDEWKEAQRAGARISKDTERALWKRFTHARSAFEKARKHHFAQLDKDNAEVADRKEALVARAEALQTSTDWDSTARAFRDLMNEWRQSGRGRRSVDDALWRRFQAAQDAFFDSRRQASDAEDAALAGNVEAKEAVVVEAEALLPITDLATVKQTLRALQDRYEAAGRLPRADAARLAKRLGAVERAVREAEDAAWNSSNPELEKRASGAAAQLYSAIAELESDLEKAKAAKDARAIKAAEEALAARRAWLAQIEAL